LKTIPLDIKLSVLVRDFHQIDKLSIGCRRRLGLGSPTVRHNATS